VQLLMHGAYKRASLGELMQMYFASREIEQPAKRALLVQDLASGKVFPKVEAVYAQLGDFLHEDATRLDRLLQDGRLEMEGGLHTAVDDTKRPSSLYQVALDIPPVGELSLQMMEEIIATLGKAHAYCIVAYGPVVVPVLSSIVERERLTSFVILKDPDAPSMPTKLLNTMHMIMHPTLVLMEGGAKASPQQRATTRLLEASITRYSCPSFDGPTPDLTKDMTRKVIEFFRESSWVGALTSDGTDPEKPVITRLTGGINAWRGTQTKQEEKKSAKEKAKKFWARLRIAYKLGAFFKGSSMLEQFLAPIGSTPGVPRKQEGRRQSLLPDCRQGSADARAR